MSVIDPMLHHTENDWSVGGVDSFESRNSGQSVALWIVVAILAAVLGALIYYGYRTVRTQDARITHVFGDQGVVTSLSQRADSTETKLRDLAGSWDGAGQRLAKLESRVAADAKQSRLYVETLTQNLHEQITAEMNARDATVDARLRQVESQQADQQAQMARVEASLKQEISSARAENDRDVSGLRAQQKLDATQVTALSERLERQRVDFELAKGQTKELIPGVSLRIRGVNPGHQRYHGTLWLQQDQRTVWLRDQSIHEPVRFFHKDGGEPYELVMTDVNKNSVAGYILVPVKTDQAADESSERPVVATAIR